MEMIGQCVSLLRKLVAIPSESRREKKLAFFLEKYLREELKMDTRLIHVEGDSYNVVGHFPSKSARSTSSNSEVLMLGGHIDTVSPSENWRTDPYELTEDGDFLRGLGSADMKGGLAAQITVLKRILEEGKLPDVEIEFVGLADEERYSAGANSYVKEVKSDKKNRFFIMAEPHYDNIVIGAVGKILLSIQINGKEGHASNPEKGINAVECMAAFLTAIHELYWPKYLAGECGSFCTLQISSKYTDYSLNIPVECKCLLNKQLLPEEDAGVFKETLRQIYLDRVGKGILKIQREIPSYPAYRISPEEIHIADFTGFLKNNFQREPELRINQGVSDGNLFYPCLNIPTILYGPQGMDFHTENECVSKSSLVAYMEELYSYICRKERE